MDKARTYTECPKCKHSNFAMVRGDSVSCRNCGMVVQLEQLCRESYQRGYQIGFKDGAAEDEVRK